MRWGLEVDSRHQLSIEQIREHVVAVDSFLTGHVYLHSISEPEEPLSALSLPDERVERTQQRRARDEPGALRFGMHVHGTAPAVDRHFLEQAIGCQPVQNRPCRRDVEPVVVREITRGPHTVVSGCQQKQLSLGVVLAHRWEVEMLSGQHTLRKVVDPPERDVPVCGDSTLGEQPFECVLALAVSPPWPCAFSAVFEVGHGERPPLLNLTENLLDISRMLRHEPLDTPPRTHGFHSPTKQPVPARRQQ